MTRKKLLLWLGIFLLLLPRTAKANSQVIFKDDFNNIQSTENWVEVSNYQYQNPNAPCRGSDAQAYHFEVNQATGQVELQITYSVPCSVVALPIVEDQIAPENIVKITEFEWTIDSNLADRYWLLNWQDKQNFLAFHIYDRTISLQKYIDGESFRLLGDRAYFAFNSNTTYHIRTEQHLASGVIRVYIDNRLVIDLLDDPNSMLATGTPGLMGGVGAYGHSFTQIDNWHYRWEDNSHLLNVPLLKQTDQRWSSANYDHASQWANNYYSQGIGRWGCALTSATMLLRYHGLTELPSGEQLWPETLNNWLNNQPDGYWAEGLLNWRALSRLSLQIQTMSPTLPALEFFYAPFDNTYQAIKDHLDALIPSILALPGHFVVATGYELDEQLTVSDLWINDPYFLRDSLSDFDVTYSSSRHFTPSFTDLSALTLIVPDQVILLDENDQALPFVYEQSLLGSWFKIYDFPKFSHTANWRLQNLELLPASVNLFAYDQAGEVKQKELVFTSAASVSADFTKVEPLLNAHGDLLAKPSVNTWWQLVNKGQLKSPRLVTQLNDLFDDTENNLGLVAIANWQNQGWLENTAQKRISEIWQAYYGARAP